MLKPCLELQLGNGRWKQEAQDDLETWNQDDCYT